MSAEDVDTESFSTAKNLTAPDAMPQPVAAIADSFRQDKCSSALRGHSAKVGWWPSAIHFSFKF